MINAYEPTDEQICLYLLVLVPVSLTACLYVQMIQCLIQSTFSLSCKKQVSHIINIPVESLKDLVT